MRRSDGLRHGEGRHAEHGLAGYAEGLATRDEDMRFRTPQEDRLDHARRVVDDVFRVVDDHQDSTLTPQVGDHVTHQIAARRRRQADRGRDAVRDL